MSNKTITGFGDSRVNGLYVETGTFNGQPYYVKNATTILAYYNALGPYTSVLPADVSNTGGYYILRIKQIASGAIPITVPEYRVLGTSPTATSWKCMLDQSSGQTAIGTVS
jgi:hypothetical protein